MTINEIRSRVFTLGNRLTAEIGDRSVAFEKAWEIVKAGCVEVAVKGVSFGTRQEALSRLATYKPADVRAFIMPEPENPVDRNAMAVMVGVNYGKGFYKLGYVPKDATATAAAVHGKASIKVIGCDIRGAKLTLAV